MILILQGEVLINSNRKVLSSLFPLKVSSYAKCTYTIVLLDSEIYRFLCLPIVDSKSYFC